MTPEELGLVAELCAERAGLGVDPEKAYLVESRLAPLARREGFASVEELVRALGERREERLAVAAAEAMAPSETGFFRDRPVFERLWREVVPELARRRPDGVVRIWSAGCAAGQEIYSFAMLQAEAPAPTGRVELFASDFNARLLERAQAGLYSSFEVQRGLSARQLVRHFENRDEHFQLARRLRQEVRWRRVNLLDDLTALGEFDVVLCRNVLGAMTAPARRRALDQLARVTAEDGVLVLGADEGRTGDEAAQGFAPFPTFPGVLRRVRVVQAAA